MPDAMTDAAPGKLIGSYSPMDRAAMGVVPVLGPGPPRPAARRQSGNGYDRTNRILPEPRGTRPRVLRNTGAQRRACLVAAWFLVALLIAWFKFGDGGAGAVAGALLALSPTFVPVGFILYGSLASTTRRPVPRLPWRRLRGRSRSRNENGIGAASGKRPGEVGKGGG